MTDDKKVGRPKLFDGDRTRFSVTLPIILANCIAEEAKRQNKTVGQIIREAVGLYVANVEKYVRKEKKNGKED